VYRLELRTDPKGLHFYAKVAPTTAAKDLRILMEGGVIDQASFAFTVAEDTWEIRNQGKPDEVVVRTIQQVGDLFDVTVTAQGAYPQTDSQVVRSYAVAFARSTDKLPDLVTRDEARTLVSAGRDRRGYVAELANDAVESSASPSQAETPEDPAPEAVQTADAPAEAATDAAETSEAPPEAVAPPAEPGEGATEPLHEEGEETRSTDSPADSPDPLTRSLAFDIHQSVRRHRFLLGNKPGQTKETP
jgi:hypothetical protein